MILVTCPRHGITAAVFICEHVARSDAKSPLFRISIDGEEMDRWVCGECYHDDGYGLTAPWWRMVCMDVAKERLKEYVKAGEE